MENDIDIKALVDVPPRKDAAVPSDPPLYVAVSMMDQAIADAGDLSKQLRDRLAPLCHIIDSQKRLNRNEDPRSPLAGRVLEQVATVNDICDQLRDLLESLDV